MAGAGQEGSGDMATAMRRGSEPAGGGPWSGAGWGPSGFLGKARLVLTGSHHTVAAG